MDIGDEVRIAGTDTPWDGKEGRIEASFDDGTYTVAVTFPGGGETLQDFDGAFLEPADEPGSADKREALASALGIDDEDIFEDGGVFSTPVGDFEVTRSGHSPASRESGRFGRDDDMVGTEGGTFREFVLNGLLGGSTAIPDGDSAESGPSRGRIPLKEGLTAYRVG